MAAVLDRGSGYIKFSAFIPMTFNYSPNWQGVFFCEADRFPSRLSKPFHLRIHEYLSSVML